MSTCSLIPYLFSTYVTVYVTVFIVVVTTVSDSNAQDETHILPYLPSMTELIESLNMTGIDYSNLLTEYSKICPSPLPQCGSPCKCKPWCIHDNDCCPDCPYTFLKRGCFNVAIVGEPAFHKLINECPLNFAGDEGLKNLCASNDSDISPVTYMVFGFKNKHCAECHGLKEHDFEPWDMVLECKNELPPDFKLDTMLEETLKYFDCVAKFEPPILSGTSLCNTYAEKNTIHQCNVTGLLGKEDSGLRWACENLDSLPGFDMFKNVYCYLCNPSIASTATRPPLQDCRFNITCEPDLFSKRLYPYGNACKAMCYGVGFGIVKLDANSVDTVAVSVFEELDIHTGLSTLDIELRFDDPNNVLSAIKPFFTEVYGEYILPKKNIYMNIFEDRHSLKDAPLKKLQRLYTAICGNVQVCTQSFDENITGYEDGNRDAYYNNTKKESTHEFDENTNNLHLQTISKYKVEYDNRQLISVNIDVDDSLPIDVNPACITDCSCDPECLHSDNCCIDILLKNQPFSCYSNEYSNIIYPTKHNVSLAETHKHEAKQHVSYFAMVDNCLNETSEYLTNMCIGSGNYIDGLSNISVTSDSLVFKNMYCLLCNLGWKTHTHFIKFKLECDSYLESNLFSDLRTMLLVARTSCKTRFITEFMKPCKQAYKTEPFGEFYTKEPAIPFRLTVEVFSKCNMTGLWTNYEVHIQEICEAESESILRLPEYRFESKVYKNFACYECNPDISTNGVNVISSCTGEQANENCVLTSLCNRHPLHKRWYPYKNLFCTQCNEPPLRLLNIQEIKQYIMHSQHSDLVIVNQETFTYRNLFGLKSVARTEGSSDAGSSCTGIYDKEKKQCREFQCGEGRRLVNKTCQTIPSQPHGLVGNSLTTSISTYLMRIRVRPEHTFEEEIPPTVLLETLCNDLLNSVWENFRRKHIRVFFDCIVNNASCDEVGIPIGNLSYIALTYSVEVYESNVEEVEEVLVDVLTGSYVIGTTHGSNVSLKASPISKTEMFYPNLSTCSVAVKNNFFNQSIDTLRYIDKFLNCPHVVVNETDVDIDSESGVIKLRSDGSIFTAKDFDRIDNGFMICEEDYKKNKQMKTFHRKSDSYEKAYKIFNDVCIFLSLICLLLTFVTYSIFKKMRTTPGKNIMTLTFTLFLAQLLILIAPILSASLSSCVTLGALVHYFWLSTFTAMCACSFNIFKSFYLGSLSAPGSGSKHIVTQYNTFVFGVPLAIVSAYITFHMTTGDGFSGYSGKYFCFIRDFNSLLLAFILPSLVVNIACIALFSMSFHRIRTSPNMAGQRDRNDVMICIKLCIIVGITWPLQVVDGILELSALSFIVTGLNALQGVFIFIAYICNARTAKLYNGLVFTKRSSASSETANTKLSQATRSTVNDTTNTAV